MKNALIYLSLLILCSCSLLFKVDPSIFEDTEGQNIESPNNNNNITFKTNRKFTYQFINSSNIDSSSKITVDTVYLNLKVLPGSLEGQTKIKYEYFENYSDLLIDSLLNWEITGLVENEKNIWIHPPRAEYEDIEFSAFPEVRLNKKLKNTFKSGIYVGKGWGEYKGITIRSYYCYTSDTTINFNNEKLSLRKYEATSISVVDTVKTKYYFNKTIGFWKISYDFKDHNYEMILIE